MFKQVKEIERELLKVKESCREENKNIKQEKQIEIENVKLEAERTTGGLRKLYQSLQVMLTSVEKRCTEDNLYLQSVRLKFETLILKYYS